MAKSLGRRDGSRCRRTAPPLIARAPHTARRPAAEQCDEVSPFRSITLSARSTRPAGMSWPIVFAAFKLMTRGRLLDRNIGRLGAAQNLGDDPRSLADELEKARAVGREAGLLRYLGPLVDCGQALRCEIAQQKWLDLSGSAFLARVSHLRELADFFARGHGPEQQALLEMTGSC